MKLNLHLHQKKQPNSSKNNSNQEDQHFRRKDLAVDDATYTSKLIF